MQALLNKDTVNFISDKPPLYWTNSRKGTISRFVWVTRCIPKPLRICAYTQPSLILMFPALYIITVCREALDMERSHGEEGVEGKCRKDKGHDLWYRPGPLAEFRRIPMRCRTGVGNNSIYCNGGKLWVHKKCSGLQRLTPNPDYRCAWCIGNAHPKATE